MIRITRVTLGVLLGALLMAGNASAVSPNLVISQVYGGGGNTGATFTHDFIEVFNRGTTTVDLTGHTLQYGSATGNIGQDASQITPLSGSLAPGQYLLVQEAQGAGGTTPLPTPDITDPSPIAMAALAAKVMLVNSTVGLNCGAAAAPCSAAQLAPVVDRAVYGGANLFEGTGPAPVLSNTTAALRLGNGCVDTDDNSADFVAGAPNPRNRLSPPNPCTVDPAPAVDSTIPGAGGVLAVDGNIGITFTEPVNVTGTWFDIACTSSGAHTAAVSGGLTSYALNPDSDFVLGESCTVTVFAAGVTDQDTNDPPDNMAANHVFTFTTPLSTITLIHEIQGSGLASPDDGVVRKIEGIVVGDFQGSTGLNGFFVQEENADADANPATSEGIFVFAPAAPAVAAGDQVQVQGTVDEFNGLTELTSVTFVSVQSTGNTLPTASTVTLPVSILDDFEPFEGMRTTFPQTLTASETFTLGRFGEVALSWPERLFTPTQLVAPGAPAIALQNLNDRSRIQLDDGSSVQNPAVVPYLAADGTLRIGDTTDDLAGVLSFAVGVYEVHPTQAVSFDRENPRPEGPPDVGGSLRVGSANVLNYFTTLTTAGNVCGPLANQGCRGANSATEFTRQRTKLVAALTKLDADILGLTELENNVTDAPIADLVDGLNDAIGPGTYAYIPTGDIGGDAIRVGLIYKPDKVTPVGDYAVLDSSVDPDFIDILNRPALAQTFQENGTEDLLTVAANHLKSKNASPICTANGDGDKGDGQGPCNQARKAAAEALVDWLATDPTDAGGSDYLIIGDLNSYAQEDPITAIEAGGYTNLVGQFVGPESWSFVFQAQSGTLDYALANPSLADRVTGAGEYHINADEPIFLDYNTEFNPPSAFQPNEFRAADHDPLLVGVCEATPPELDVSVSPSSLWPPNHKYRNVTATVDVSDGVDSDPTLELVSVTSNEPDNGADDGDTVDDVVIVDDFHFKLRAERSGSGTGREYTITYKATDACGNETTASATVTVPLEL